MTTDLILHTSGLGKQFKKRWAVRNLSLEVRRGDVYGFLGPNGAGKSTTIRMLLSLIRPSEGDVRLFGHSIADDRKNALTRVGGIVEKPDFYLYLSAVRNLEIVGSLYGGIPRTRVFEVLEMVGLKERAFDRVKTYSHGMKQRLGIAQALLSDPELIILDEPTSGLDPQGMKDVRRLILSLSRERGKTVFLSSHLLSEIEMVANRMAIVNKGELVVQGDVTALLDEGERYVIVRGQPTSKIKTVLRASKQLVPSFKEVGGEFYASMRFEDVPVLTTRLVRAKVKIEALIPKRSLEDYFLSLTQSETIS